MAHNNSLKLTGRAASVFSFIQAAGAGEDDIVAGARDEFEAEVPVARALQRGGGRGAGCGGGGGSGWAGAAEWGGLRRGGG